MVEVKHINGFKGIMTKSLVTTTVKTINWYL